MKCQKCGIDLPENQIHESHDVPCYLFLNKGNRKGQKKWADKFGRHMLCKTCHDSYEMLLNYKMKVLAMELAEEIFENKEEGNNGTTN